jgi:hypothetical protein
MLMTTSSLRAPAKTRPAGYNCTCLFLTFQKFSSAGYNSAIILFGRVSVNFQANYAALNDDELLAIAASRADLVQEAALAMDSEMARRRLRYQEARTRNREAARLEFREATKHHSARKRSKYFVARLNGWKALSIALGVPLLLFAFMFFHLVPKEWYFPILGVCMGGIIAVSAVQPWLRQKVSFWVSLVASCTVQLLVGYWISVHLAPQSRGEVKGAGFLAIISGYAVGIPLFLLLQKFEMSQEDRLRSE